MPRTRTARTLALGATVAVAAFALTGCAGISSVFGPGEPDRDETGQITEEQNIDIFAVTVGDCLPSNAMADEMSAVDVVPCSEPHGFEVYHEFNLEDGEYPAEDDLWDAVGEGCIPAFDEFVGIAFEESALEIYPLWPTEASWEELDDRLVQCLVNDPAEETIGSLRDAAR